MSKPKWRHESLRVLKRFQPTLVVMGLKCTHYTLFNRNCNYAYRLDEWYQLQAEDRPLLLATIDVIDHQLDNGSYFLLENPLRSELWDQPKVKKLLQRPDVWSVTADAGAFGASVEGYPIGKPFRFVGDMAGLDTVLGQRLTPQQRAQCVPVQGSLTHASQEYPEQLCRAVLQFLRDFEAARHPVRFCTHHPVLPVQSPTTDLSQWNDIVEHVEGSYHSKSGRPYYIPIDTDLGKKVQDLFRLDASKIQVVATPTTRRIPSNVDEYFTRAAFLYYNDGEKAVEVEDLDKIMFPKQRFSKPVRFAIFAYGYRRPEETAPSPPRDFGGPSVVPNMPTDIDFPSLSSQVGAEVKSAVARLHLNMGHPSREELCRLLAYQGDIPDQVYECARKLRCATCERMKPPQQPRPSTTPNFYAGQFGDEIQMDVFYSRTLNGTTLIILGMVDRATGLQQASIVDDRSAHTMFHHLENTWLKPYGLPLRIVCDPDTSFKGAFQERVHALGCLLTHCPPEAHHTIGVIERRNALLRLIFERLVDQFGATSPPQCKMILSAACHAINAGIHTHGRSAYQAVFGRQP